MSIVLKRIYEEDQRVGGYRVLIDRIWPRGISKEDADLDEWMKEVAPSSSLRKWFDHDKEKFSEFKQKYKEELKEHSDAVKKLREAADGNRLVLLYGAKDKEHNHAIVLKEYLEGN